MKREYFIVANSFAAPFFSDTSESFVKAHSAPEALEKFAAEYNHPCGLYAADAFKSADAYHKGHAPLSRWRSNKSVGIAGNPKEGAILEIEKAKP
jgi:hypothetical protein